MDKEVLNMETGRDLKNSKSIPVIVGRPFAPIGRGEDVRASFRAFRAARYTIPVYDVYSQDKSDPDIERELSGYFVDFISEDINIFFINGDEVSRVLSLLDGKLKPGAYNIVYPAWELGTYPQDWAKELERFDEVWSQSRFVYETLQKAVSKPVHYLPLASQVEFASFLPRMYFGLPESAHIFLFFFDFTSYIDRKNPMAVLHAFERVCAARPQADLRLVMKTGGAERRPEDYQRLREHLEDFKYGDKVIPIDRTLGDNEIKNLVRVSDSFISLHRAEGFGRGAAEAMCLGKPVIGTAYSGNLDFMNESNSCPVRYKLIPVQEGQYPYAGGQMWADPDLDHAVYYMLRLLDDPDYGRRIGAEASRFMRQFFSYRAIGLKYKKRMDEILGTRDSSLKKVDAPTYPVHGPIIVYQMAKVGSRSIVDTLKKLNLDVPVYHRHVLEDLERMIESVKAQGLENPEATLREIQEGMKLRALIEADRGQQWNIITLVRDPVAQNISRFFQSVEYEEIISNARKRTEAGALGLDELVDVFIKKWKKDNPFIWFEKQLKPVFDIDVFSMPFPREKGFDIIRKGRFSVLIIRLEDMDRCAGEALEEFLGIPGLELVKSNVGSKKWYSGIYKEFTSKAVLPREYFDNMYNSKWVEHFYSPEETRAFRAMWCK